MDEQYVEFTETAVKAYLDNAITKWRKTMVGAKDCPEEELVASCYIDAFQSMRESLFKESLQ